MTILAPETRQATPVFFFYALPALPLAAIALPLYIIVPSFYAASFALPLEAIGVVLLAIRLIDAVTDPVFGWLADRVSSPIGRRRGFFLGSLPLTALAAFMLFWPPTDAGLAHLAIWGVALSIGTTWTILPYTAWGAELSGEYHERVRVSAWREGATLVGSLLAISLPFAGGLERADGLHGLAWIAIFIVTLLPLTGILAAWRVPEPVDRSVRRLTLRESLSHLTANRPFLRLGAAFLLNSFANAVPASLFIYFVTERLAAPGYEGPLLFAYFLAAILGVPVAVWASYRWGKHRAWSVSMALACFVFSGAGFLGEGDVGLFATICVVTGLLLGFDLALPPAIQADAIDHDTVRSGEQRSGLYFAAWSFITKLSLALSAGVVFPILGFAGFSTTAGQVQDAVALDTLGILYAWLPILPKLAAIALMWRFSLDHAEQQRLRSELAR